MSPLFNFKNSLPFTQNGATVASTPYCEQLCLPPPPPLCGDYFRQKTSGGKNPPNIADISHYRHYQRWCTFFKSVPFLHRERTLLACIGYFVTNSRTFWCPFYRPKLCGDVQIQLTNIRLPPNIFWRLP